TSLDRAFGCFRPRRESGCARRFCFPFLRNGLDLLPLCKQAVRASVSANSDFCTKRYSFLFRLRRGMDRSGRPVAFWVGGGGVGCEPTIFPATGRGGFGLAVLADCRARSGFSRAVEIQRHP